MKIKKMGLSFAPKNREYKIDNSYSIDEVCDFFAQYLNDEFELTNEIEKNNCVMRSNLCCGKHGRDNKKKQRVNPFRGLDEMQALMLSTVIIGARVIIKYCKDEKPHWMRIQTWKKSLQIANYFEKTGQLNMKKICFFVRKDFIFLCRLYEDVSSIGTVILPEAKPFRFTQWLPLPDDIEDIPIPLPKMPPLMNNTDGTLKKRATKMINEYNFLPNES